MAKRYKHLTIPFQSIQYLVDSRPEYLRMLEYFFVNPSLRFTEKTKMVYIFPTPRCLQAVQIQYKDDRACAKDNSLMGNIDASQLFR